MLHAECMVRLSHVLNMRVTIDMCVTLDMCVTHVRLIDVPLNMCVTLDTHVTHVCYTRVSNTNQLRTSLVRK